MARAKKVATAKDASTPKAAPVTRKRTGRKAAPPIDNVEIHREVGEATEPDPRPGAPKTIATVSTARTAGAKASAPAKAAKAPTLEQVVAKLKQHGIHFNEE